MCVSGADPGFLKGGGVHLDLGLQAKKGGGGPRGGPTLGPMLKSLHRGPKGGGGGPDPLDPPPPGSATVYAFLVNKTKTYSARIMAAPSGGYGGTTTLPVTTNKWHTCGIHE